MKTIKIQIYSFDELPEEAKQTAIENQQEANQEHTWFMEEAGETLKRFCKIFDIDYSNIDFLETGRNQYKLNHSEEVRELTGVRLLKFIWNNYKKDIYKGKYYSLWSKTELSYKHHENGFPVLKHRYSKIMIEADNCPLTGVCYDFSILDPMLKFLAQPTTSMNFEELLDECIGSLCEAVQREFEYNTSEEGAREFLNGQDYEFTADGKIYKFI